MVKCPTSAQVMISWFTGSSPESGSVLMAQSLQPASDSVSPSLSAPPLPPKIKHLKTIFLTKISYRGAWVAQSVKLPTLDFGSGHDLMVCGFELHVGLCVGSVEPAWDSLCLCASPPLTFCLSQK